MHQALQHVFDEHADPTHCATRDVHDMVLPIMALAAAVQMQVIEYRKRLQAAKYVEHDRALDGKMERLKQKLKVLEEAAPALVHIGERIADAMTELDHVMAETHRDLTAYAARTASAPDAIT